MADTIPGHLVGVTERRYGSTLTADLVVGDTVLNVASTIYFDEENGGDLLVGGVRLSYAAFDDPEDFDTDTDGPTTLTLTAPSTVAADEGDAVWVYDPTTGADDPAADLIALVTIDDRDPGDALPATIRSGLEEQLDSDFETYLGKAVDLEVEAGELMLVNIRGSRRTGKVQGYQDGHVAASASDLSFFLTYRPLPGSTIHFYWNGIEQEDDAWSLDGWTFTVNDPDGLAEADDRFYVKYLYTDPTLRPPITGSVTLVGTQTLQNNLGLTSADLPAGTQTGDILLLSITSGGIVGTNPTSSDPRMTVQNDDPANHLFTAFGLEDGSGDPVTFSVSDTEYNGQIVLAVYRPTGVVSHVESNGTTTLAPDLPAGVSAALMVTAQASDSTDAGGVVSSPQGAWVKDVDGHRNSTLCSAWSSDSAPSAMSVSPTGLTAWRAIVVGLADE